MVQLVTRRSVLAAGAGVATMFAIGRARAAKLDTIRVDYAYYNPVALVLKDKGWVEEEFGKDGTKVEWVLSLGSNKGGCPEFCVSEAASHRFEPSAR